MIVYNGFSLNNGGSTLIPKDTTVYSAASFKPYPNTDDGRFNMQWWDMYAEGNSGPIEEFTSASYVTNGINNWEIVPDGYVPNQLPTGYEYRVNFDYNDRLETIRSWESWKTGTGTENFSNYYTITNWDWIKEMKVMDCNYCSGVYYQLPNCTDLYPNFANTDNLITFGGDYPSLTSKLEPVITKLISLNVIPARWFVHTHNQSASGAPFRNSTGAQDYAHCVTASPTWFN